MDTEKWQWERQAGEYLSHPLYSPYLSLSVSLSLSLSLSLLLPRRVAPTGLAASALLRNCMPRLKSMAPCSKMQQQHQWSSGRIHRCHRCDPGPIPGRCILYCPRGLFFSRHHDTAWRGRLPRSRGGGSSQLGIFSSDVQLTSRTQVQGVVQQGAVTKQHGAASPSHNLSCALIAVQQAAPLPCPFLFARFKCRRRGPSPGLSG